VRERVCVSCPSAVLVAAKANAEFVENRWRDTHRVNVS